MSMLNIKKSSARFLNPINNDPTNFGGIPVGAPKQMPHTNIDKYPGGGAPGLGIKPDASPSMNMPPRGGIREAKNHQLFDKYMNRHGRKASMEMPSMPSGAMGGNVPNSSEFNSNAMDHVSDFALPSLGKPGPTAGPSQLSGRNTVAGGGVATNFSSRKRGGNNEAARASLSDSDFDF